MTFPTTQYFSLLCCSLNVWNCGFFSLRYPHLGRLGGDQGTRRKGLITQNGHTEEGWGGECILQPFYCSLIGKTLANTPFVLRVGWRLSWVDSSGREKDVVRSGWLWSRLQRMGPTGGPLLPPCFHGIWNACLSP